MNKVKLGTYGETLAIKYLVKNNFIIWERNWKCRIGELDIIASKERVLHIIEVKLKNHNKVENYHPIRAVDQKKQIQVRKLAKQYYYKNIATIRRRRIKAISHDVIGITYKVYKGVFTRLKKVDLIYIPEHF